MINAMTRHQRARLFKSKASLLGIEFEYNELEDDRVGLTLFRSRDTEVVKIPSFVTDIVPTDIGYRGKILVGPLHGESYSIVYVDNDSDCWFNASWLCAGMKSKQLKIEFKNPDRVTDISGLLSECTELELLDISNIRTDNVASMRETFNKCIKLAQINLSNIDTHNVKDMTRMFAWCESVQDLDMSGFNTNKVTSMAYMFLGCTGLTEIDLNKFETSNVTNMRGMFRYCRYLKNIQIGSIDTGELQDISEMFYYRIKIWGILSNIQSRGIQKTT